MARILIQTEDFDVGAEYDRLRRCGGSGAIVTFTGLVRDFNRDQDVDAAPVESLSL